MPQETILIIEDDKTLMRGINDNFEFAGFTIITSEEGEKGFEKDPAHPDFIKTAREAGYRFENCN